MSNIIFKIKSAEASLIKELQAHLYSVWAWKCLNNEESSSLVLQYLKAEKNETVILFTGTETAISLTEENVTNFLIKKDADFICSDDIPCTYTVTDTVIFKR